MNKKPFEILNQPEVIDPPLVNPTLPHEQDETIHGMKSPTRKIVKRAANDLKLGLKDTDRGLEMDKAYKKQK